jgi:hypothetical protein
MTPSVRVTVELGLAFGSGSAGTDADLVVDQDETAASFGYCVAVASSVAAWEAEAEG